MNRVPEPPFLVVRPGAGFWVETASHRECRALPASCIEDAVSEAYCYDASGGVWPIAAVAESEDLFSRLLPWRQPKLSLRLDERREGTIADIIFELLEILEQNSSFLEGGPVVVPTIKGRLAAAQAPADVIAAAENAA